MRRPVVASAILATILSLPLVLAAPSASATPPTDPQRATAALQYLLAAQRADGSIDGSLGETADFVIGTAAAGYDPATLHGCTGGTGALEFLATASDGAAADAAATGKAVLAVVAAGGDPSSFAGRNLLARLTALYHSAGGAYGDGATFSQSFAILALVASGQAVPADAVTELKALQDSDGSWSFGTAPVAAGQGDTNSTAIALMALDAAGIPLGRRKGTGLPAHSATDRRRVPVPELVDVRTSGERPGLRLDRPAGARRRRPGPGGGRLVAGNEYGPDAPPRRAGRRWRICVPGHGGERLHHEPGAGSPGSHPLRGGSPLDRGAWPADGCLPDRNPDGERQRRPESDRDT